MGLRLSFYQRSRATTARERPSRPMHSLDHRSHMLQATHALDLLRMSALHSASASSRAERSGYGLCALNDRQPQSRDFNDDSVDAGELGNGEEMTAFYELILADDDVEVPPPARGRLVAPAEGEVEDELSDEQLMSVRMRYKLPDADESSLFIAPIRNAVNSAPSLKFIFASTVAHLGLTLRRSAYLPERDLATVGARLEVFGDAEIPALDELRTLIEAARAVSESEGEATISQR